MKYQKLIFTAVAAFVMASVVAFGLRQWHRATTPPPPPPREELPKALVVYCFHDYQRGPKYERMKRFAHETLEKDFGKELKEEKLVWMEVNYRLPENSFIADEYEITAPCIVLVDGRPGKQRAWKNYHKKTEELIDDEKALKDFFRGEIQNALK